jgi:hypothetical protein
LEKTITPPNTGSSRTAALSLAHRHNLPEMYDNREGVSPVPPLPLSHSVNWLEMEEKKTQNDQKSNNQ